MRTYREEIEDFLNNKIYMIVMTIVAIACYGYSAMNTTISIDDLNGDYYFGSGNAMLSAGRFGMVFWSKFLGFYDSTPPYVATIEILAVVFFIWAIMNFCVLFQRASGKKLSKESLLVFSTMWLSYPLMNEIWEYSGANVIICGGFLFVSYVMLMLQRMLNLRKVYVGQTVLSIVLLTIVASSYESVVIVYVFAVTAVLLLQELYNKDKVSWKGLFAQIGIYVGMLVTAILGRVVVGKIILVVLNLEKSTNGATGIAWDSDTFATVWEGLKTAIVNDYVWKAFIYFPLAELLIACVCLLGMILYKGIKSRNIKIVLPMTGMYLSLVLLSLVQGTVTPYRACQVFGIFVAFASMLVVNSLISKSKIRIVLITGFMLLVLHQSMYLSYFLNLNHMRSEEEAMVIREIGNDMEECDKTKPVIFLGEYSLSNYITESASISRDSMGWRLYAKFYSEYNQLPREEFHWNAERKIVSTNVRSVITWAAQPENGQYALQDLFQFYGFDYKVLENEELMMALFYDACNIVADYWDNVGDLEWKNGYAILEAGECVIVHLR